MVLQNPLPPSALVREIKLSASEPPKDPIPEIFTADGSGQSGLSFALIGLSRTKQEPIREKVKIKELNKV